MKLISARIEYWIFADTYLYLFDEYLLNMST